VESRQARIETSKLHHLYLTEALYFRPIRFAYKMRKNEKTLFCVLQYLSARTTSLDDNFQPAKF